LTHQLTRLTLLGARARAAFCFVLLSELFALALCFLGNFWNFSRCRWADKTEENCAAACCDDALCTVYQYCPPGVKCTGLGGDPSPNTGACFTGRLSGCAGETRPGWVGKGIGGASRPAGAVEISGVRIAHNAMSHGKGTQATLSVTQTAATFWHYDFCDTLVRRPSRSASSRSNPFVEITSSAFFAASEAAAALVSWH
jgi:hypothetical protein